MYVPSLMQLFLVMADLWLVGQPMSCLQLPICVQEAVATGLELEMSRIGTPECYFTSLAEELRPKRDWLANALSEIGLVPIVPQGGYFMIADTAPLSKVAAVSMICSDVNPGYLKYLIPWRDRKCNWVWCGAQLLHMEKHCCVSIVCLFLHELVTTVHKFRSASQVHQAIEFLYDDCSIFVLRQSPCLQVILVVVCSTWLLFSVDFLSDEVCALLACSYAWVLYFVYWLSSLHECLTDLQLEDDGRPDDYRFVYWLTENKVLVLCRRLLKFCITFEDIVPYSPLLISLRVLYYL